MSSVYALNKNGSKICHFGKSTKIDLTKMTKYHFVEIILYFNHLISLDFSDKNKKIIIINNHLYHSYSHEFL